MKQKLFTLFAMLICSISMYAGGTKVVYTVFDEDTGTLTYYYDSKYDQSNPYHEEYDPVNHPNAVRFTDYNKKVKKAVIDPSMKEAPLTSMYKMFYGGTKPEASEECSLTQMTTIEGLENLNTTQTTFMAAMFSNCFALKTLDLSSFDTSKVRFMTLMFSRCNALTSLDLSSFDTSKVTDMMYMFAGCSALTTIYCGDDWSKSAALTDSQNMFSGCTALVGGDGTAYNEDFIDATYARLDGGLKAPGYFTSKSKAKKVYTVFDETAQTLTYRYDSKYDLSNPYHELYDPVNLHDAVRFTEYYDKVKKVVIDPSMKNAPLTLTRKMFQGGFNEATYTSQSLTAMTTIEGLENLNTSKMTDLNMMFFNCSALKSVDLTSFDISNVTDMSHMFHGCSSLTTIYCNGDWSTSAALEDSKYMFASCTALVGGERTAYNEDFVDATYARLDGGLKAPGYFTSKSKAKKVYTVFDETAQTLTYRYDSKYDLSNPYHELYDPAGYAVRFTDYHDQVKKAIIDPSMKSAPLKSMRNMFYGGYMGKNYNLSAMTTIEGLENLNTAIVTNMANMFAACSSLTSLDLSLFDTHNVTDMSSMFDNCSSLQELNVNSFDIGNVMTMAGMFSCCSELTTIYCSNNWSNSEAASSYMFNACNKLVGGEGTPWSDAVTDASYARPDGGLAAPGYFTLPVLLKGDADNDGQVTAADIVAMTNYMTGNPPADFYKANADVNRDGAINIADIVAVSNIILSE